MALEGSLLDFGLADILQLIYFQKKTGILTLSGRTDTVRLIFSEGNVVAADSRKRMEENRLGRILLKRGLLGEDDLRSALEEQKATGARIGDILIFRGIVEKETIRETLISQVTETVVQLFSWKEGTYEFQAQPVSLSEDMPIILDTQHLLMEGLRVVDEWSVIEGKMTHDTVFRKVEAAEAELTPQEEVILSYVDGESDASIIIDLSGMGDFEASKTLVSLMEKGAIEPVETIPVSSPVAAAAPPSSAGDRSLKRFFPLFVFLTALVVSMITPVMTGKGPQLTLGAVLSGDSVKRLRAAGDIDALRFGAEVYKYRTGSFPADLSQIGKTIDAWGNAYRYSSKKNTLTIISAGPDGRFGTPDDVF